MPGLWPTAHTLCSPDSHRGYVRDKGYDSENIHRIIRDDFESFSLIPVKTRKRKRIIGYYRRELAHSFDVHLYHRRNLVETVFSVLIVGIGECLKSRKYHNQVKEIKIKLIFTTLAVFLLVLQFSF
jgi:hypothetical protein